MSDITALRRSLVRRITSTVSTLAWAVYSVVETSAVDGRAEMTIAEIADTLGMSQRQVYREADRLEAAGFLAREEGRATRTTRWVLSDTTDSQSVVITDSQSQMTDSQESHTARESVVAAIPAPQSEVPVVDTRAPAKKVLHLGNIQTPPATQEEPAPPAPPPVEVAPQTNGRKAAERTPADLAYHSLTKRWLPAAVLPLFDAALAEHGAVRFAAAVTAWAASPFNPQNHKGQLDWIRKGVPERHRLDSDTDYEAKAAPPAARSNGNGGYTTKTERNVKRIHELAEDIAALRGGPGEGADGAPDRDRRQELPGDGPGAARPRREAADRGDVGGDRRADPDRAPGGVLRVRHA